MADKSQQTEKPTPKRLQKARDEGRFPISRELIAGVQYASFVWALCHFGSFLYYNGRDMFRGGIESAFSSTPVSATSLVALLRRTAWTYSGSLLISLCITSVLPFSLHLLSTRLGLTPNKLAPDFSRLNPLSRVSGMFAQNTAALTMVLLALLAATAALPIALSHSETVLTLPLRQLDAGIQEMGSLVSGLLWRSAFVLLLLGIGHYGWQTRNWSQSLKMSKQELKDESKESDGSPEMKMRLRRLRRNLLRRQMMKDVATATAVVTNPTHYAVAIRYDTNSMGAPVVVAKGRDFLALRIRERALAHQIPIVQNPPLAQALYKSVEVGQEIPPHLYRAIAEILAYIFRLMNDREKR